MLLTGTCVLHTAFESSPDLIIRLQILVLYSETMFPHARRGDLFAFLVWVNGVVSSWQ